jgi:hypothetical protein
MTLRLVCPAILIAACTGTPVPSGGGGGGGMAQGGGAGGGGGLNLDGGPPACTTANSQPDVCGYGNFCDGTTMTCAAVQVGMCSNILPNSQAAMWKPGLSTGPVIYASVDDTDIAADCMFGSTPFTVTLFAYTNAATPFPSSEASLPGFFYFTPTGTQIDIAASLLKQPNYVVSTDSLNATFTFTICSTTGATSIDAGFAFTGGNPFCATLNNP